MRHSASMSFNVMVGNPQDANNGFIQYLFGD